MSSWAWMTCSRTSGTPRPASAATSSPATSDTWSLTRNPTRSSPASIDRLRSLVANNGVRREHLNTAAEATSAKLSELEQTIRLRRESGFDAALAVVKTDRGRASMDQVRSEIAAMGAEENATRVRLRDGLQAALKGTTLTFTLTSVLALVLLFGIHLLSERSRGQLRATRRLAIHDAPQHGRRGDCHRP